MDCRNPGNNCCTWYCSYYHFGSLNTMKTKLAITALILAVSALLCWRYYSHLDNQLTTAKDETALAKQELTVAKAYTKTVQAELNDKIKDSDEKIALANKTIAWLESSIDKTHAELAVVIADKKELSDAFDAIQNEAIEDVPVSEVIFRAQELYPSQDLSGVGITANEAGRVLLNRLVSEVGLSRQFYVVADQIQSDYQDQVYRLEAVIAEHEKKYLELDNINLALQNYNQGILLENAQYVQLTEAQAAEIKIYEAKDRVAWIKTPVGMITAGLSLLVTVEGIKWLKQ